MWRDYEWASKVLHPHRYHVGDLASLLDVGPRHARTILHDSGLPCRLRKFRWQHRGRWYVRRVWAIPQRTMYGLLVRHLARGCGFHRFSASKQRALLPRGWAVFLRSNRRGR